LQQGFFEPGASVGLATLLEREWIIAMSYPPLWASKAKKVIPVPILVI
jgi:hypothetical protein